MQNAKSESITVRLTHDEAVLLRRASAKARMALSDYLRSIVVPWAESDIESPLPKPAAETPVKRREPSPVTRVARSHGMTRDEYRDFAAKLLAEAELEREKRTSDLPPPHRVAASSESGFFQRKTG